MKQKNPKDRTSVWEHESRVATPPAPVEPIDYADYPHALPRTLHNDQCDARDVATPEACEAALAAGYALVPPGQVLYKDSDTQTVYSSYAKAHALSEGWSVDAPAPAEAI
jgi:hypothetical protein